MDLRLVGRKAQITGSKRGIGRATGEALLREGARVVVNGRSPETVGRAVEELAELGSIHGDLGTAEGVEAVIDEATADGSARGIWIGEDLIGTRTENIDRKPSSWPLREGLL